MINKSKIIFAADDEDIKLLVSKAYDLYVRCEKTGKNFFTKFLTPLESKIIKERFLKDDVRISFFGGYGESERNVACFHCDEIDYDKYPVCAVIISQKNKEVLSHRDYLGSILGLGIKRELIGDIVIRQDDAVVFCLEEIAGYIEDNLLKVGNSGVKIKKESHIGNIEIKRNFEDISLTVSSMRSDCIVSALCNVSRSKASEFIERGLVTVNYEVISSNSRNLCNGDVISVRGKGKFKIVSECTLTKKGRMHFNAEKYM